MKALIDNKYVRLLVFAGGLAVLLLSLSFIFEGAVKRDMTIKQNWVLSIKNKSFDFAVMGSSRGYESVHISTLERLLKRNGINLSMDGVAYPEQCLVWEHFLKYNRVKVLLFQVDPGGLDNRTFDYPYHDYIYYCHLEEPVVFRNMHAYFGEKVHFYKYLPFLKYVVYNNMVGLRNALKSFLNLKPIYDSHGSRLLEGTRLNNERIKLKYFRSNIDSTRNKYFLKILDLAKSYNIKTVLFMAPVYNEAFKYAVNLEIEQNYYKQVAADNGIVFFSLKKTQLNYKKEYFYDYIHLNRNGALAYSGELYNYLVKRKIFADI